MVKTKAIRYLSSITFLCFLFSDVKRVTGAREVRGVDWVRLSAKLDKKTNDRLGAIEVMFS